MTNKDILQEMVWNGKKIGQITFLIVIFDIWFLAMLQGAIFPGSITPQGPAHTISCCYWDPLFSLALIWELIHNSQLTNICKRNGKMLQDEPQPLLLFPFILSASYAFCKCWFWNMSLNCPVFEAFFAQVSWVYTFGLNYVVTAIPLSIFEYVFHYILAYV